MSSKPPDCPSPKTPRSPLQNKQDPEYGGGKSTRSKLKGFMASDRWSKKLESFKADIVNKISSIRRRMQETTRNIGQGTSQEGGTRSGHKVSFSTNDFGDNVKLLGKRITEVLKMSSPGASAPSGRAMKYPYTYTAKIVQFPLKYYINNTWLWKYYFIAVAVSFPIFYKISRISNNPENVKKWDEIRMRDIYGKGHH